MERKLLINMVMCPDGTILKSNHRHDYKEHTDANGRYTMVDGGQDYLRRGGVYTDISVYSDDPFEVIRRNLCRGGRGIDGKQPLTQVPLFRMSDAWLQTTIAYVHESNMYLPYYKMEQEYRKVNNISIKDKVV